MFSIFNSFVIEWLSSRSTVFSLKKFFIHHLRTLCSLYLLLIFYSLRSIHKQLGKNESIYIHLSGLRGIHRIFIYFHISYNNMYHINEPLVSSRNINFLWPSTFSNLPVCRKCIQNEIFSRALYNFITLPVHYYENSTLCTIANLWALARIRYIVHIYIHKNKE